MRSQWSANWAFSAYFPPNDSLHAKYECYAYSNGNYYGVWSQHPGGVNACFTDGAVRFVNSSVDLTVWKAISTIAGGEAVGKF